MTVRCKFKCTEVTKREAWSGSDGPFHYDATFHAVTGGSEDNESFFAATPSGELKVSTLKADHFEPGKEYFVDLIPA